MAAPKVPVKPPSLVKREPVLMASGVMTVVSTVLFVAPAFGIKIPDKAAKMISLGMMLAGGAGVRNLVKPI